MPYTELERKQLLTIARNSIEHGLRHRSILHPVLSDYSVALNAIRASFVTLQRHHQLRGCIGKLEATRPLAEDVACNAFAAAFEDPRFPGLQTAEWHDLELEISILTVAEPLHFNAEHELLQQLRPFQDGLILSCGSHRATFLPSVWESLPDPAEFLKYLKRKAGLNENYWSETLRASRYQTEVIK